MFFCAILFTIVLPLANIARVPGEAIVRFDKGLVETSPGVFELPSSFSTIRSEFDVYGVEPLLRGKVDELDMACGFNRSYVLRFDEAKDVGDFIASVSLSPDVELAEPNYLYRLCLTPNDPLFTSQWHLPDIKCPQGWDVQTGGRDVVIAVVDAGLDTAHPDLNANIWRNTDEVLDGTDSDGNGYIDDILGWDWTDGDNDPTPTYFDFPGWPPDEDHGTWCNGIANAVTDNGIGIAGVAYNVRMMGFRCTANNSPGLINTTYAVNAMNYARLNGANIISCSWGGNSFSSFVNNAIQTAHYAGLVICAAAGNDNSGALHYPSAYDNVIAVAGTDHSNHKWTWGPTSGSNYGTWVDVCAPAVDLYGCDTDGQGSELYESAAGTSGSCPQVAGLAALLFQKYPDSSNTFIENAIFETCDPVDDSLFDEGKLGYGKINVFKALGRNEYSWPVLCSFGVSDSVEGNNNGRPEPGDTCRLTILLTNESPWSNASNLTVKVGCVSGTINFIDSTAEFCEVTTTDTVENVDDEIVFEILPMEPGWVTFIVTYLDATPPPYPQSDTFEFLVGFPLLLVDDDDSASYEDKYEKALDMLHIVYEYWNNTECGEPGGKLLNHPAVVWFTGDDSRSTLTSEERNSLTDYLTSGGKLFLTGQNIAQDIAGESFLADYLKCSFVSPAISGNMVTGKDGDEVGEGLNILTSLNQTSRDEIASLPGADTVLFYNDSTCAGIKYEEGDRRVVFFSWGLEGVIDHHAYSSKAEIMQRVITWLDSTLYGVEEEPVVADFGLHLYPNPASSKVTFMLPAGRGFSTATVKIYDVTGRQIDSFISEAEGFEYDVEKLSPGVYFYRVEGGKKEQGKFVVIR
ncbi:hypothetical protein CH333_03475 [candidate division WOR-3 bacterium JGI_Cruoil_03_44_89]|uniref:Peptidase S8/S53 domain-containing protein n=1 Tax=candidate division WOR-3 bacterium JGI_Cruoil_03_44_89 TaxID=1973748 RepID=A0A235BVZ5_UNCW3|nr:MAG: hypothetical protein CH333_03475 [candidate division WOR-3 bacterium JGI_Cruoil_03_44_89]